mmetsp:Transcript_47228/g.122051  ORF Transcript_47228/g.122051 Transcript_47228/m.122051 type:complete len:385 (+) Transcript_47228:79-1233(+)
MDQSCLNEGTRKIHTSTHRLTCVIKSVTNRPPGGQEALKARNLAIRARSVASFATLARSCRRHSSTIRSKSAVCSSIMFTAVAASMLWASMSLLVATRGSAGDSLKESRWTTVSDVACGVVLDVGVEASLSGEIVDSPRESRSRAASSGDSRRESWSMQSTGGNSLLESSRTAASREVVASDEDVDAFSGAEGVCEPQSAMGARRCAGRQLLSASFSSRARRGATLAFTISSMAFMMSSAGSCSRRSPPGAVTLGSSTAGGGAKEASASSWRSFASAHARRAGRHGEAGARGGKQCFARPTRLLSARMSENSFFGRSGWASRAARAKEWCGWPVISLRRVCARSPLVMVRTLGAIAEGTRTWWKFRFGTMKPRRAARSRRAVAA